MLALDLPVIVVAVSTTVHASEKDRVKLPNRSETPASTSGLQKPSWAVPRWYVPVEKSRLTDRAGYISGKTLKRILVAVDRYVGDGGEENSITSPPDIPA